MSEFPYDDALRGRVARLCGSFERLAGSAVAAGLKPAAVAIALIEAGHGSGEAAFLLTRRGKGLRAHGGQWALPGGRCDPGETGPQAALRELREEVGLALEGGAVLGLLDDYPTRSGYLVTPVVVWVGAGRKLVIDRREVASVHRIRLADIVRADAVTFTSIPESERRVVRVRMNRSLVHAPTAAYVYQFRELLMGRTTRVADLEQPVFAWR